MKIIVKRKHRDGTRWTRWFAWRPVKLTSGWWAWMEVVETRKEFGRFGFETIGPWWTYRGIDE